MTEVTFHLIATRDQVRDMTYYLSLLASGEEPTGERRRKILVDWLEILTKSASNAEETLEQMTDKVYLAKQP